ncbi:MAG: transposase [Christensenellales bacterium]
MLERGEDLRYTTKFVCLDSLIPEGHLLRRIEKVIDFGEIYEMVEYLYCEDNGRPAVAPVVLVKMVLLQHLYGIKSLRQTVKEVDMNIAYRWFIGYDIDTPVPHFATISYAFASRFPSKELAKKTARVYDEQLREEINTDREAHGKKALGDRKDDDNESGTGAVKEVSRSTTDPGSGLFHKGDHKVEFAYTAHVACDENNFVLSCEVTPGNVHDSMVFDGVYEKAVGKFEEAQTVAADAGHKTPWICKKVQKDGRSLSTAYKRPLSEPGFFRSYEYVYDEYYDCILCPNNQVLRYSTTNCDGYREFKSSPRICAACPYLSRCTESANHQKVVIRHILERHMDAAEDFRHSPAGRGSYGLRSRTIERVFADAKEKHGMRYTLHKGLYRVRNWVRRKFAALNLKKWLCGPRRVLFSCIPLLIHDTNPDSHFGKSGFFDSLVIVLFYLTSEGYTIFSARPGQMLPRGTTLTPIWTRWPKDCICS